MTKNKGQRRIILTEEDYTAKLSSIVARDFFPDISKFEKQNDLLDCRLKRDAIGAVAVRREARRSLESQEAAASQREFDEHDVMDSNRACRINGEMTLRNAPGGSKANSLVKLQIRKRPRPLEEETITGFFSRATNEDDEEFDSNLKREIKENRQKLEDIYGLNRNKTNTQKQNFGNINSLALEMASDDFAPESNRIEHAKPPVRNGLFFNPTPMIDPSRKDSQIEHTREKGLLGNASASLTPRDQPNLMLPPSREQTAKMMMSMSMSKRSTKSETDSSNLLTKSQLVEYIPKHTLERKIEPSATRFPSNESIVPTTRSNNERGRPDEENDCSDTDTDVDIDYMSSTTDASTDLDAPVRSVEQERRRFKQKQESDNRRYVTMTPQIIPGIGNESPITTWGSIDGTPQILSGQEEPPEESITSSPFRISSRSKRECAANKAERMLAERANLASSSSASLRHWSSKRKRKKNRADSEARGLDSLTPAAVSLMEKMKSGNRNTFRSALRTSYTPRVHHSSSSSSVSSGKRSCGTTTRSERPRKRDHVYNATPQR
mmetsp:Transcript_14777/g.41176  ORF Transcript_14777/g.41176 Transcript_14777/m.41176 type:complete len:551 (+) Transcript_14777:3-1655(+)